MRAEAKADNVLTRIVEARRASVAHRKRVLPEPVLRMAVAKGAPVRDFAVALSRAGPDSIGAGVNIIAELKRASPSRGILRDPFDPPALAAGFENAGAAALSVLTEEEFFCGSLENLRTARQAVTLPVLRKDFIFEPWQVWETRASDADSFLLIVAVLADDDLHSFIELGRHLGMEPLVEAHTGREVERAVAAGARIIGVNNRDLRTLEVRAETSFDLIEYVPDDCIAVCESGLSAPQELVRLRAAGYDAFLVGEHLMRSPDPAAALRGLLGS